MSDNHLVNTCNFTKHTYLGDPINAARIFSEMGADELCIFDIDASSKGDKPNLDLIAKIADQCEMPLCYGGGIQTAQQAHEIISLGLEKVAIGSGAVLGPDCIKEISNAIGGQSVVLVIDVASKSTKQLPSNAITTKNGTVHHNVNATDFVKKFKGLGIGEIIINSIGRDGSYQGYDIELMNEIRKITQTPLVALGGAGSINDINSLFKRTKNIDAGASSIFLHKGHRDAVLISYPSEALKKLSYG